jgi:phosphatidylglycerophosphate synthase
MEEKRFDNLAWWFHRHGIRPDHFTYAQTPIYIALVIAALRADVWAFFILTIIGILIDGADGILARRTGTVTRRGHLLDSFFDILGIGITIWAASIIFPNADTLIFPPMDQLLLGLLMVNFLVYLQNEIQGTKAVTYTRGPLIIGMVLEPQYEGLLLFAVLLPLLIGLALIFTRVAWRRRLWNWYQYLTAGRRKEYKAIPRLQRAENPEHPARFPARVRAAEAESEDESGGGDLVRS